MVCLVAIVLTVGEEVPQVVANVVATGAAVVGVVATSESTRRTGGKVGPLFVISTLRSAIYFIYYPPIGDFDI